MQKTHKVLRRDPLLPTAVFISADDMYQNQDIRLDLIKESHTCYEARYS